MLDTPDGLCRKLHCAICSANIVPGPWVLFECGSVSVSKSNSYPNLLLRSSGLLYMGVVFFPEDKSWATIEPSWLVSAHCRDLKGILVQRDFGLIQQKMFN